MTRRPLLQKHASCTSSGPRDPAGRGRPGTCSLRRFLTEIPSPGDRQPRLPASSPGGRSRGGGWGDPPRPLRPHSLQSRGDRRPTHGVQEPQEAMAEQAPPGQRTAAIVLPQLTQGAAWSPGSVRGQNLAPATRHSWQVSESAEDGTVSVPGLFSSKGHFKERRPLWGRGHCGPPAQPQRGQLCLPTWGEEDNVLKLPPSFPSGSGGWLCFGGGGDIPLRARVRPGPGQGRALGHRKADGPVEIQATTA